MFVVGIASTEGAAGSAVLNDLDRGEFDVFVSNLVHVLLAINWNFHPLAALVDPAGYMAIWLRNALIFRPTLIVLIVMMNASLPNHSIKIISFNIDDSFERERLAEFFRTQSEFSILVRSNRRRGEAQDAV